MSEVNRLEWDAYIRDSELMTAINRIERRVGDMAAKVSEKGRSMEDVFSNMAKAAAGFLTLNTAQNFIQQLVKVRSEFQQLDIAFTTMLGSKERADKLTKDLIEFAGTTPFGMKDTANAAKQLLAYGSTAENVKNELRMLGDVAAGTSQPIGDLVYLYGTLRTQGRAYLMDIRQFAGRGIPIYKELANVLKINESQVNDFVSAGKVGFAEVQQAFQNMTATGSMFGGLMEAQSRTIQGELERLGDAYDQMLNKIGGQTEGLISNVIQGASTIIENYETVLEITSGLIVVYGAYRAALIATAALHQLNAARVVGLTTVELLHYGAIVAKTAAMRVLNAVMLASPVVAMTAGITVLVGVIYSLTQVTNATTAAQEKLNEAHESGASKADQEKRSIEQLVAVLKDNTASAEQKKVAYDKLQSQTKGILLSYSQEEIAIGKATKSLDDYILKIREAASARKAFDEFNALAEDMDKLNRKGIEGVGTWTKLGRSIKNTFTPTSQGISFGDWASGLFSSDAANNLIVGQEKEVLKKSMDELKKEYGDKWNEILTGVKPETKTKTSADIFLEKLKDPINNFNSLINSVSNKSDLDNLKKAVTEKLEALAPGDSNIASYKKKLEQIAKLESQYSISGKKGSSTENSVFQEAERYNSIQLDLEKAKQQRLNNQLTRDQQEVQSVKDKYNSLREEVRKFNADPRNKVKVDGKVIDDIEKFEVAEVNTKIDTRYIVDNLSQQKALYDQFEAYKLQVGEEKAKERFGNELDLSKTFGQLAEKERYDLLETDPTAMTAAQKERLEALDKIIAEHDKNVKAREFEKYAEALKSAQSLSDKLLDIEKDYQEKIKSLKDSGDLTPEREKILNKEKSDKTSKVAADDLTGSDSWISLFNNLDEMTSTQINIVIKEIEAKFSDLKVKFNPIDLDAIRKKLEEAKAIIIEKNPFGQVGAAIKEIMANAGDDSKEGAEKTKSAWLNLSKATKGSFDFVSEAVNSASVLKDSIGEVGATALASLSALSVAAVAVSSAVKQAERASIILAIIQAALIVVQSLFSFIDGASKKRNKQLKKEQEYYNTLSETFDILIDKQKELFSQKSGRDSMDAYKEALDLVNSKIIANRKSLEAWFSQGASLFKHSNWYNYDKDLGDVLSRQKLLNMTTQEWEQLLIKQPELWARLPEEVRNYGQSVIDAKGQTEELKTAIQEALSGISLDSVKDEFDSLFSQADLTFGDISDSFYKHMQKAALRLVQDGKMTESIQKWYDKVINALEDENLTKDESDALKAEYQALAEAGNKRYQAVMDMIGYEEKDSRSGGLSGSIKRELTEATASELAGLGRSSFDLGKRDFLENQAQGIVLNKQVDIANRGLTELNQINVNTANTVVELKNAVTELQKVNKNLGGKYQ